MIEKRTVVSKIVLLKKKLISWLYINKNRLLNISIISFTIILLYLFILVFKLPLISDISINYKGLQYKERINQDNIYDIVYEKTQDGFFLLNIVDIQNSLKQQSSLIKEVIVRKDFPNTLIVDIIFHRVAIIIEDETNCILLNQEGYVIDMLDKIDKSCSNYILSDMIYLINNDKLNEYVVGQYTNFKFLKDITNINKIFSEYHYNVKRYEYNDGILTAYDNINRKYIFTSRDNINDQQVRLVSILEQLQYMNINYVKLDLRFNRPVIEK